VIKVFIAYGCFAGSLLLLHHAAGQSVVAGVLHHRCQRSKFPFSVAPPGALNLFFYAIDFEYRLCFSRRPLPYFAGRCWPCLLSLARGAIHFFAV
jgi:hypothetical protein